MSERFMVTGALGCIGAWTVRQLVRENVPVWTYDLPGNPHRLHLVMAEDEVERVHRVHGDITDLAHFERTVLDHGISHIIHLAAMQVPFVRADPVLGMRVNVVGTTIVLETAARYRDQVQGVVYASSTGVYGPADRYPAAPLAHDALLDPPTLYGVTKQANEATARIYWQETGLPSIGLRPYVIYGPGRDQGMTSSPTKAMLAAAVGRPYHISFGGSATFHHARDAASVFVRAARIRPTGAPVFNLGGICASMAEVVAAIEAAAPQVWGRITFEPQGLGLTPCVDDGPLSAAIGPTPWSELEPGVAETLDHFRAAVDAGRIDVHRILA